MPMSFPATAWRRRSGAAAVVSLGLVVTLGAPGLAQTPPGAGHLSPVALTVAGGVDPGAAAGQSLNLRRGWTAEVWANVPGARRLAWTPDGRLLVSTGATGTVMALTPAAGGQGPAVTTLISGLNHPQGLDIATRHGRHILVVGDRTRIVAWDYANGAVSRQRVIVDGLPSGGHDRITPVIRGDQVFYNLGSLTNDDPVDRTATTPERATIRRAGLDGTGDRLVATGVRNGSGLDLAPDGTLWASINQADNQPYPFRDDTGQYGELVPSYINENPVDQVARITAGTELGWPYCVPDTTGREHLTDLGYVAQPLRNPDGAILDCSTVDRTALGLPAHSAPLGFAFTHDSALPRSLSNGALITSHGSWNRTPPREPSVVYSAWDNRKRTLTPPQDLVTGFQNPDGTRWGRSVDAIPGPDGALYVSDDAAGLVYRLAPPRG
ncbi:glucose/arabinose dehydrogenase [Catenuloplanes nepalensis]|uniref:Glucose/arabinose dehydrogenase n=1 Tax=Catenuloplanes nepalensis TaxID=587533 RepID=A0ABT9MMZ4_9ACTN|nr:gluconolaconase [Catenuloplanes nepalensis]MDP9792806.1 glucose/arabinose dehydrogenase [Catenuloplanes nepalensis]